MGADVTEKLRQFEADHAWVNENLEQFRAAYRDQWIAVKDGQVLDSDANLMALRGRLTDPANTCIEFITREPLEMVL